MLDGFRLRPVVGADFDRIAQIYNYSEIEPVTGDLLRQRFFARKKPERGYRVVVENPKGKIVAYAHAMKGLDISQSVELIRVDVDPKFRGRGIGRELLERVEKRAVAGGSRTLNSKAREDDKRSRRFLQRAGYASAQLLYGSTLDPRKSPINPRIDIPGIKFYSLAEIGDDLANRKKLAKLAAECERDTPGADIWGVASFKDWSRAWFDADWYSPERVIVAVAKRTWVGLTGLGPTHGDRWGIEFTGVAKKWRGLGIATALKRLALAQARIEGAKEIYTFNDDRNRPMIAVNKKLGFKRQTGVMIYTKPVNR